MNTSECLGLVGGIGPESTVDYYRRLHREYGRRTGGGALPVVINSVDLRLILELVKSDRAALAEYVSIEIGKLADAGASIGAIASNTPHLVFDEIAARSTIPLVSIVSAVAEFTHGAGYRRVGLLGTLSTMEGGFYQRELGSMGVEVVTPPVEERRLVHGRYMSELVPGIFRAETKREILSIVTTLRDREAIDAVVLGGTELPLLLRETPNPPCPLIDSAWCHVDAILSRMLFRPGTG